MHQSSLLSTVKVLQETPTAPFREEWMLDVLDKELSAIDGLRVAIDRFGNRIVRFKRGRTTGTPVTYIAHVDHPGFIFLDGAAGAGTRHAAIFEGRVLDGFFVNSPVRLYRSADDAGIRGIIVSASEYIEASGQREIVIETEEDAEGAVLAMWDIPPFRLNQGIIEGRACDDLCGCAALIEMLRRLSTGEGDVDVCVLFTRAEESGFCGLLCFLDEKPMPELVPANTVFVSVEISSQTASVAVGEGAIIRVGDRSSTFDGKVVDLLWGLTTRMPNARARRALMDKGTCEATPAARAGHRAGGICCPVDNYHNMDIERGIISTERVALSDLEAMVDLAAGLAESSSRGETPQYVIPNNYERSLRKGYDRLTAMPLAAQPAS
ncbi:hypothetical protein BH09SUM1_BH09SUM1_19870 [soil metagenome]